jgi:AraC-like DNA-binding protein
MMDLEPRLRAVITASAHVEALFDHVPDVVYFVKDGNGRYQVVNQTLVARCGLNDKRSLLGRTAEEVFPPPLGARFLEQDLRVCREGLAITQQLELHLYPTRTEGWCLTDKIPLRAGGGAVIGVAGISRDLQSPGESTTGFAEIAAILEHVRAHLADDIRVSDLARMAGLSTYQLNRRLRLLFGISASQLVTKARIDAASTSLRSSGAAVAEIAHACGYCDQSAFARVFRRTVGLSPQQYRLRHAR